MAVPCTVVASGGVAVTESQHGSPFTPTINAFPVTIVSSGGFPVVFVSESGVLVPSGFSMQFLTGMIDPRITFTRSTTATRINSAGQLVSEAINAPRFDYTPVSLAPRGLFIEPSAINIAARARNAAGWTLTAASTSGTATSLWGDTVPILLASAVATAHRANSSLVVESLPYTGGDVYVHSFDVFLPSGSDTQYIWARLRVGATGNAVRFVRSGASFVFDLSAAFGTNPPPNITASDVNISAMGNGWFRIEIRSQVSTANGTFSQIDIGFSPAIVEATAGTANTTIALDNINVIKTSTFGLSRINTTTGAVTRAADVAKFTPPAGVNAIRFTFDDNTTQDVNVTPLVEYTIPTTLNRRWIRSIASVVA